MREIAVPGCYQEGMSFVRRPRRPDLGGARTLAREAMESRTEVWREVGLGSEVDRARAHRAQGGVIALTIGIAGVLVLFSRRQDLFPGLDTPVRVATVVALLVLGLGMARSLGRGLSPLLYKRLSPGSAGTVGFLVRLVAVVALAVVALRIAGLNPAALALGGAVTAVVLGLAAQQTLGNLFAGLVLLGTRPFRVGERVRLTGGSLAGSLEGTIGSLGLFYTSLVTGEDRVLVPNSIVLQLAIVPLREPDKVELRARFDAGVTPGELQERLGRSITTPVRYPPHIALEELHRDEVVVRIVATPRKPTDGAQLAGEILAGVREGGAADGAPVP